MFGAFDWIEIPPEEARRHPLYGVGGWLVVLAMALVLASVAQAAFATVYQFSDPVSTHPGLSLFALIEGALNWALALGWLGAFYLLLSRSRLFPVVMLALVGVATVLPLLDVVVIESIVGKGGGAEMAEMVRAHDHETLGVFLFNLVVASGLVGYLGRSRRVAVTFLSRVRRADRPARAFEKDSTAARPAGA